MVLRFSRHSLFWFSFLLFLLGTLASCGDSAQEEVASSASSSVYENTSISGTISTDQEWKGVIHITGDVNIEGGATLTIHPGTQIKFAAGADDQSGGGTTPITDPPFPNDPAIAPSQISSLNVKGGTLRAVGTADAPIIFTSAASTPTWGDWHSIQYNKSEGRLSLEYTVIEYGYAGVQINTVADDTRVTLKNSTLRHIITCGICGSPTDKVTLTFRSNDISDCGHEGVAIFEPSHFTFEDNIFHDNVQSYGDGPASVAVNIDSDSVTLRNNQFLRNWIAINFLRAAPLSTISGNTFTDNTTDCNGPCPSPLQ